MAFPRGRPVLAVLEQLDRLTTLMPAAGFTIEQVAAKIKKRFDDSRDRVETKARVRSTFSKLMQRGRLRRVGPDTYQRIPGVPLTQAIPKGLVRDAVREALYSDRHPDPWFQGEIIAFVARFTGRKESRVRNPVNWILGDFLRHCEIVRSGTRTKYRYQLRRAA